MATYVVHLTKYYPVQFQTYSFVRDLSQPGPVLSGLVPLGWTLGPSLYNILHLIRNIYINRDVDLFLHVSSF